jgi:hypothetical protein
MIVRLTILFILLLPVPLQAKSLPSDWLLVGEAHLKVLWFDIYKAKLFTPDGRFSSVKGPLILQLNYLRDIERNALLNETKKELKRFIKEDTAETWVKQLASIFVDIKKGDKLSFWIDRQTRGHFSMQGRWIGSIDSSEFSTNFVRIWLSKNGRYPKLAKQLTGDNSNGASSNNKDNDEGGCCD